MLRHDTAFWQWVLHLCSDITLLSGSGCSPCRLLVLGIRAAAVQAAGRRYASSRWRCFCWRYLVGSGHGLSRTRLARFTQRLLARCVFCISKHMQRTRKHICLYVCVRTYTRVHITYLDIMFMSTYVLRTSCQTVVPSQCRFGLFTL